MPGGYGHFKCLNRYSDSVMPNNTAELVDHQPEFAFEALEGIMHLADMTKLASDDRARECGHHTWIDAGRG